MAFLQSFNYGPVIGRKNPLQNDVRAYAHEQLILRFTPKDGQGGNELDAKTCVVHSISTEDLPKIDSSLRRRVMARQGFFGKYASVLSDVSLSASG